MIHEVFDLATEVAIDGSLSGLNHFLIPFRAICWQFPVFIWSEPNLNQTSYLRFYESPF